jgi:hypothetical protein
MKYKSFNTLLIILVIGTILLTVASSGIIKKQTENFASPAIYSISKRVSPKTLKDCVDSGTCSIERMRYLAHYEASQGNVNARDMLMDSAIPNIGDNNNQIALPPTVG